MSYYGGYFGRRPTGSSLSSASHKRKRPEIEDPYAVAAPSGGVLTAPSKRARMAYRSRRRNRRGRRRFGRRRVRGFPASVTRRVRTVFYQTWNLAAASALAGGLVKLNSAFDPSGDFGSGQPLTHDQYSALYRKYQVMGFSVKAEIVTTDNTYPLVVGFTPLTTGTLLTSYQHYKEFGQTVSTLVSPDQDKSYLFCKGSCKRYLAPVSNFYALDDAQALISADPAKMVYGHLWAQPVETGIDPGSVHVVLTLTQVIRYFDRETPARS